MRETLRERHCSLLSEATTNPKALSRCGNDAFIHHLYVRNGSRQKGIGKQLLDALSSRLPRPWRLKCVRANDGALAFYLDHGWREISSGVGEDGPYSVLEKA